MLQPFVRMGDSPVLWHIGLKEIFCFFDLPNPEPRSLVDLMLKKNWHCQKNHLYFAALQIDNYKLTIKN